MKYLNILASFQKYCFQETKKNAIMSHYRKKKHCFFYIIQKTGKLIQGFTQRFYFLTFFLSYYVTVLFIFREKIE